MLVTQIKPEKEILERISGKNVFIFLCPGCREVYFPQEKAEEFIQSLPADRVRSANLDYLCNREFVEEYIQGYSSEIERADVVLVFSCGVGTQVVSSFPLLENKIVYTGCDTLYLDGFQGITVQNFNCDQCGECYLNHTGGICPITHCAKGLINGPCGGAKDGKCEVNPDADCAWILIYKRLKKLGRLHLLKEILPARDYHKIITESLARKKL